MENKIFISYKRVNLDIVEPIVQKIEQEIGFRCWIDLSGIESGDQFDTIISKAIQNADIVIFMMSKESLAPSKYEGEETWTQMELRHARKYHKRIVPVSIDGSRMKDCEWFDMKYGGLNSIDYSNDSMRDKLFRDLRTWLGIQDKVQIKEEINEMLQQWKDFNKQSSEYSKKKDVLLQKIIKKEKLIKDDSASTYIMSNDDGQIGNGAMQVQIECLREMLKELHESKKDTPVIEVSRPESLCYRVCSIPEDASLYYRAQREGFTGNFEGSFNINYHANSKTQQCVYYAAIQSYVGASIDSIALGRTKPLTLEEGKGNIAALATITVDDNLIPATLILLIQKVKVLRCEKLNVKFETNNYGENITVYGLPKESFVDVLINFYLIPEIGIKSIKVYNAETESLLCIY